MLCRGRHNNITTAHCFQSTNFSNGPRTFTLSEKLTSLNVKKKSPSTVHNLSSTKKFFIWNLHAFIFAITVSNADS